MPENKLMREQMEKLVQAAQNTICKGLEEIDGKHFVEDRWQRPGGGGGITRILAHGNVFEKAGVNTSIVYGDLPVQALQSMIGDKAKLLGGNQHQFYATGISLVLHAQNPMVPTVHANYRYFEIEGNDEIWWFGGGCDLTPSYLFEEDASHFHRSYKEVCDRYDLTYYPQFKQRCDEYFFIPHRGESRGIGGIFFDHLNNRGQEEIFSFVADCAQAFLNSYLPIVHRRKDMEYTEQHKSWQRLRHGRYVEFNLIYDRGTTFGLKTGGRTESILMSLPASASWEYDHKPQSGSREEKLLKVLRHPQNWV